MDQGGLINDTIKERNMFIILDRTFTYVVGVSLRRFKGQETLNS